MVRTAAFHAIVRGSFPGIGGLKETKNVPTSSTRENSVLWGASVTER